MTGRIRLLAAFVVAGFSCSVIASAQVDPVANYTDSLLRLVHQATTDSQRFERYLDLSLFWSDRDTAAAFRYIAEARKIAGHAPTDFQQGLLHLFTANVIFSHRIAEAMDHYMSADKYLSKYSSPTAYRYRSRAWNNYGILYQISDSAERYMNIIIDRAIPYARLAGDSTAVGNGLLNIGLLLANVQDYDQAEQYYRQAMHTFSRIPGTEESQLTVFVNAAKVAIMSQQLPQARSYLDSSARVLKRIPHSAYAAHYYRNEGIYYRHMRQKESALKMFTLAVEYAEPMDDDQILRDIYFELYATYRDFGENVNAKKYLTVANRYNAWAGAPDRLLHLREMAETEYRLGNFRAAFHQMKAYALGKDTFTERNTSIKIMELEKKYETIEKENEILKLQDVNYNQQKTIDSNRLWMTLLLAALAIALITAFFSWKLAQSNRKTLLHKEQLHKQELKTLKQEEELNQYQAVLHVQEDERNRIARDLHDGLGGLLAGVKLRLSSIASKNREKNGDTNAAVHSVIGDLDYSVNELRRIARNMMPEALLYMGLQSALADLCNYLDTPATAVKFQGIGLQAKYPHNVLIGVYRIVQELLNNAVKHAQASQIIVQCSDGDNHLFLVVEDDGCGFRFPEESAKGLGLKNIENRVALLNGRLEIDSRPGHGTTINIEIPVDGKDH